MSKEQQHIDQVFKEGFQNFEMPPSDALWDNISKQIPQKKKKQSRLIVLFPLGIAASLTLLFLLFKNTSPVIEPNTSLVMDWEDSPCPEDAKAPLFNNRIENIASYSKDTLISKSKVTVANRRQKEISKTNFTNIQTKEIIASVLPDKNIKTSKSTLITSENSNTITTTNPDLETQKIKEEVLLEILSEQKEEITEQGIPLDTLPNETPEQESIKKDHWSIQPQIAALDYNALSGGSSFGNSLDNQNYDSETSYGVKIAYHASSKWSIRAGINTANFNINTNVESSFEFGTIQGFLEENRSPVLESPSVTDSSNDSPVLSPSPDSPNEPRSGENTDDPPLVNEGNSLDSFSSGNVRQQINYLEIPLEITYQILDKKIGLSAIGGVSTFILTKNESDITFDNNQSRDLGNQLINVNNTVFSNNFGLGIQYKITEKLRLNIEPTVKIQWNAFNADTEFRPYIFGIYSGISLRL